MWPYAVSFSSLEQKMQEILDACKFPAVDKSGNSFFLVGKFHIEMQIFDKTVRLANCEEPGCSYKSGYSPLIIFNSKTKKTARIENWALFQHSYFMHGLLTEEPISKLINVLELKPDSCCGIQ